MRKCVSLLASILVGAGAALADGSAVKWIDGADLPFEGRPFPDSPTYARIPARFAGVLPERDMILGTNTAGRVFRFVTDASKLHFRWALAFPDCKEMYHMSMVGTSGIDVYCRTGDGPWFAHTGRFRLVPLGQPAQDGTYSYEMDWTPGDECMLYLPCYNGITKFELGIDDGAEIGPGPAHRGAKKPVVMFGHSITQGGCASRGGLIWPAIVGRRLDVEIVNLGLSGSAFMEIEWARALGELDPAVFVIDTADNQTIERAQTRYEPFLRELKRLRPDVPMLVLENTDVHDRAGKAVVEKIIREICEKLWKEDPEKWSNLKLLRHAEYQMDDEGTVDGIHLNDLGMMKVADAVERRLRPLLVQNTAPDVAAELETKQPAVSGASAAQKLVERAKGGPSLLLTKAMVPQARARVTSDPDAKAWFAKMRADLDERMKRPVTVFDRGGQWTMWSSCRKCASYLESESLTRHVCRSCGEVHTGWPYDDAYISRVNNANGKEIRDCGVAWLITGERRYVDRARETLLAYARVYGGYIWHHKNSPDACQPGVNDAARAYAQVLDEAVWLCDVLDGYDAVADALTEDERRTICENLLRPSTVTAQSHCCEWSNHEVWHLSAFGRAGIVLRDASLVDAALHGKYGALNQLDHGILADGSWYEGSLHYHFYTMRAFTPFFRALHNLGYEVPERYRMMFVAPIEQSAPDGMMPPVNDSCSLEYLRPGDLPQHYELANSWWKSDLFSWWVRQRPRQSMEYALWGREEPASAAAKKPPALESGVLEASGLAVLRSRTPGTAADSWMPDNCLMLDFGPHGEWHGHPDKLNIFFWLHGELASEDPGGINFGALRHWGWYKATLAHNELRVDNRNQGPSEGEFVAFATNGNASAVAAFCSGKHPWGAWAGPVYEGVDILRAVGLVDDVVLDYVEADSETEHDYELCFHARGELTPPADTRLAPMADLPPRVSGEVMWDLKGDESWAWVDEPRIGAVGESWHAVWRRKGGELAVWQRSSASGYFETGVGSALPPPETLTLAVKKQRGKRAVFATVCVPDAAAKVQIGEPFVTSDGLRGFEATVNGRRHRIAVRREKPARLEIR